MAMGSEHGEISILKADAEQCNAFNNSFAAQTCPHVHMERMNENCSSW